MCLTNWHSSPNEKTSIRHVGAVFGSLLRAFMHIKFYCPTFKSIGPTPKNNRSPHLSLSVIASVNHIYLEEQAEGGSISFSDTFLLINLRVPRIHQGRPNVTSPRSSTNQRYNTPQVARRKEGTLDHFIIISSSSTSERARFCRIKVFHLL